MGEGGQVGGTGPRAPRTLQTDLFPFLPSLEVQSAQFARGDNTTVKPNKNFFNTYCASILEWGWRGEDHLGSIRGPHETTHL